MGASDSAALQAFTCGEPDLDDFLRNDAARLARQRVVRTYVAFFDGELVGYVALLADAVVLETKERRRLTLGSQGHPVVPALKIARLGVSQSFRAVHAGVGTSLVHVSLAIALDLAERVGCRLLTVDAYPESVAFYEKLGFVPNRARPYEGRAHPSMRFDILEPVLRGWAE